MPPYITCKCGFVMREDDSTRDLGACPVCGTPLPAVENPSESRQECTSSDSPQQECAVGCGDMIRYVIGKLFALLAILIGLPVALLGVVGLAYVVSVEPTARDAEVYAFSWKVGVTGSIVGPWMLYAGLRRYFAWGRKTGGS